MTETIHPLTAYKVHASVSLGLHDPYSQLISYSSFDISGDADCNGLMERLAQRLRNKSQYLLFLRNSAGLRARCTYDTE